MYNGIGLTTPRGSGTNGYVQKNMSFIRVTKEKVDYSNLKSEENLDKIESLINRKGNAEILAHERKRKIELKCIEMQELMAEQGYPEHEIESKVNKFRKVLLEKIEKENETHEPKVEYDANGRAIAKETHQLAEINDIKNRKLREAFGLGEFDPREIQKEREAGKREEIERAKEISQRKYKIELEDIDESTTKITNEIEQRTNEDKKVDDKRKHIMGDKRSRSRSPKKDRKRIKSNEKPEKEIDSNINFEKPKNKHKHSSDHHDSKHEKHKHAKHRSPSDSDRKVSKNRDIKEKKRRSRSESPNKKHKTDSKQEKKKKTDENSNLDVEKQKNKHTRDESITKASAKRDIRPRSPSYSPKRDTRQHRSIEKPNRKLRSPSTSPPPPKSNKKIEKKKNKKRDSSISSVSSSSSTSSSSSSSSKTSLSSSDSNSSHDKNKKISSKKLSNKKPKK